MPEGLGSSRRKGRVRDTDAWPGAAHLCVAESNHILESSLRGFITKPTLWSFFRYKNPSKTQTTGCQDRKLGNSLLVHLQNKPISASRVAWEDPRVESASSPANHSQNPERQDRNTGGPLSHRCIFLLQTPTLEFRGPTPTVVSKMPGTPPGTSSVTVHYPSHCPSCTLPLSIPCQA